MHRTGTRLMKSLVFLALGLVAATGSLGCTTTQITDCYGDVIDTIGNHEPRLDFLYHPALDISRCGQRDWCACRSNRMLAPDRCRRHNPHYAATYPAYGYETEYSTSGSITVQPNSGEESRPSAPSTDDSDWQTAPPPRPMDADEQGSWRPDSEYGNISPAASWSKSPR